MYTFETKGKRVDVFPATSENRPMIYIVTFGEEGPSLRAAMEKEGAADCTLVTIASDDPDRDMTPWPAPAVFGGQKPFAGGADDLIALMLKDIIPNAERHAPAHSWRGICGYSLSGLFALYSLYRTDVFSRAACMSASLWYPELVDHVLGHPLVARPDKLYFSLGDKESASRGVFGTVGERTDEIVGHFQKLGIDTTFRSVPGGHFKDVEKRIADGIAAICSDRIAREQEDD